MRRVPFFLIALVITLAQVDETNAQQDKRGRAANSERRSRRELEQQHPKRAFAQNYLCYLTRMYYMGQGQYLYYANYHEAHCSVGPEPVYAIGSGAVFGPNPNQSCPECEPDEGYKHGRFEGFESPLEPDFETEWEDAENVEQISEEPYLFRILGTSYRARLFKLEVKDGDPIYVAFEIDGFAEETEEPDAVTIPKSDVKPLDEVEECHAYTFIYKKKKILFLTDREDQDIK